MSCLFRSKPFDVIVCGGGHAGIEAALASARLGCDTLLLTGNVDTVGQMSCNPAIGGVAKGHIVREIDAMGGEMAINADVTGIQFRLLNASKGMAVQSPRAQCDKKAYQLRMKHTLELQQNLQIFQATVSDLIVSRDAVVGCQTALDISFLATAIVVTTGTFLRGLIHIGASKTEGGRMGDYAARTLSAALQRAGIELRRLKTGTPPRVLGRSLDFDALTRQDGDDRPCFFAFHDTRCDSALFHVERSQEKRIGWVPGEAQLPCWITYTTSRTEDLVRTNLHRSAMYSGEIASIGPRYCPSIEDKFVRFADKERHIIFLEPEGRNTDEYYINGLSTSLPFDVQQEVVRSIPGLERAILSRPAYAVEYDFAPPTQLDASLQSKALSGLFLAGQINGTSGYEEAAGQGLVAGVNAAQYTRNREPLILERQDAYIGVMIDDLVTKGTSEPYRMFTSRAEHRLLLNHSSAEIRLLPHIEWLGLVPTPRLERIRKKAKIVDQWEAWIEATMNNGASWGDATRRLGLLAGPESLLSESPAVREEVLYRVLYRGYRERELRQIGRMAEANRIRIPHELDYFAIPGLRYESAQKLSSFRPINLGQAGRLSGVNPSDISILMIYLARLKATQDPGN